MRLQTVTLSFLLCLLPPAVYATGIVGPDGFTASLNDTQFSEPVVYKAGTRQIIQGPDGLIMTTGMIGHPGPPGAQGGGGGANNGASAPQTTYTSSVALPPNHQWSPISAGGGGAWEPPDDKDPYKRKIPADSSDLAGGLRKKMWELWIEALKGNKFSLKEALIARGHDWPSPRDDREAFEHVLRAGHQSHIDLTSGSADTLPSWFTNLLVEQLAGAAEHLITALSVADVQLTSQTNAELLPEALFHFSTGYNDDPVLVMVNTLWSMGAGAPALCRQLGDEILKRLEPPQ